MAELVRVRHVSLEIERSTQAAQGLPESTASMPSCTRPSNLNVPSFPVPAATSASKMSGSARNENHVPRSVLAFGQQAVRLVHLHRDANPVSYRCAPRAP